MSAAITYSVEELLYHLDTCAQKWQFIVLDGGKQKPADVRITAYRDNRRWALVLEELASTSASPGHWSFATALYKLGNCVTGKQGWENWDTVKVTSDGPNEPTFLSPDGFAGVNPDVHSIRIRDRVVPIDLSAEALKRKGIPLPEGGFFNYMRDGVIHTDWAGPKLGEWHVLWSLLPENRDLLLATEEEKRRRLPFDLPKFMQLEEWNHPLIMTDRAKPSDSETFQLLAEAIVSGDPARYKPTLPPNTHWKNWLEFERV